jgi:hypothetical protein
MMIQKSVIILSNRQSKKEQDFKNKNSIASWFTIGTDQCLDKVAEIVKPKILKLIKLPANIDLQS